MIPILCDETKALPTILADNSNGLGRLDCLTAKVTEVANGQYTGEITYPVNGEHFKDIRVGGIVKMKPNELSNVQMFRISKISKPLHGVITISLNHISYDLSKTSVKPFSATGAVATLTALKNNIVSGTSYPFTYETDITNNSSAFTLSTPQSVRACLGGVQGSFLDVFGFVQFEWDNLTVKANRYRGVDRGVRIAYGKNITDIVQDENIESMYTAVQPYVIVDDNAVMGDLQTIVNATYPKVLNLDLTSEFDSGVEITKTMINNRCKKYIEDNDLATPSISIDVQFLPLWQTEDYKDIAPLERVGLFDDVTISFSPLGIEAKAKVTEYVYDVLEERYETVHLGEVKSTLGSTINQIVNDNIVKSDNSNFVSTMTNVILNSLGLFSTKVLKANGGYQYYMHNKPTLAESQYQWTINAGGFAVSQDYGQTWSAGIDSNGNAVFNSLAANIIRAMEIYGAYIEGTTIKGSEITGTTIKFGEGANAITAKYSDLGNLDGLARYGGVTFIPDNPSGNTDIRFVSKLFEVLAPGYVNDTSHLDRYRYIFETTGKASLAPDGTEPDTTMWLGSGWQKGNNSHSYITLETRAPYSTGAGGEPIYESSDIAIFAMTGQTELGEKKISAAIYLTAGQSPQYDKNQPCLTLKVDDRDNYQYDKDPTDGSVASIRMYKDGRILVNGFDSKGNYKSRINLLDYIG